jgi:hypothetical protein
MPGFGHTLGAEFIHRAPIYDRKRTEGNAECEEISARVVDIGG